MSDLQKNYTELQKKRKLPAFDDLDRGFDIAAIDATSAILREIRKKIDGKLDESLGLLQVVLQPETNMRDLHECRGFTEKDKGRLFALYRKLMILRREASLLSLDSEERREAAYINAAFAEWQAIRPQLQEFIQRMRDSWKKELNVKEELGYLG